ncbi:MAG: hypothetical protein WBP45_12635 [Daejeonella sp.]
MKPYFILLTILFPLVLNAQDIHPDSFKKFYETDLIAQSKYEFNPQGYCGTKAEIYLWKKSQGPIADFVAKLIVTRMKDEVSSPFIVLLANTNEKGIYAVEGSGNDIGAPPTVNLVFIPYKGKPINSTMPQSFFSSNHTNNKLQELITEVVVAQPLSISAS